MSYEILFSAAFLVLCIAGARELLLSKKKRRDERDALLREILTVLQQIRDK